MSKFMWLPLILIIGFVLLIFLTNDNNPTEESRPGLKKIDLKEGDGREAKKGDTVVVHYTGTLKDGTKFDSSRDQNKPFEFKLGEGEVIKGWDEGVVGMKVGGQRKLVVPPELGYGKKGRGAIPPDAELTFEVELLDIK